MKRAPASAVKKRRAPAGKADKKPAARATAAPRKNTTKPATKVAQRRADYGSPVEGFFAERPPAIAAILTALRELVRDAAPAAEATIKWGMPFFTVGGEMVCAFGAFKSHVNLILPGPPGTYADPEGRLEGEGKTGKHLKLRSLGELPRDSIRGWLQTAVAHAKAA